MKLSCAINAFWQAMSTTRGIRVGVNVRTHII